MRLVDPNLKQTYNNVQNNNKRAAAEIAYALGLMCREVGDYDGMRRYRAESIALFEEIGVNTLEEASPIYESINEILMPNLIHEGVVAQRLVEP